jgi:hypothetical protein
LRLCLNAPLWPALSLSLFLSFSLSLSLFLSFSLPVSVLSKDNKKDKEDFIISLVCEPKQRKKAK